MKKLLLVLLSGLLCAAATAQTVTTAVNLGWKAPTANTDGSTITGTLTYALYQGPPAGPFTQVATGLTGTTTVVTTLAAGNCFTLVANELIGTSTTSSAPTGTTCALIPDSPPGGLTVTVTLTIH
jgi:hypothetical protein